jgi:hypothetical protein
MSNPFNLSKIREFLYGAANVPPTPPTVAAVETYDSVPADEIIARLEEDRHQSPDFDQLVRDDGLPFVGHAAVRGIDPYDDVVPDTEAPSSLRASSHLIPVPAAPSRDWFEQGTSDGEWVNIPVGLNSDDPPIVNLYDAGTCPVQDQSSRHHIILGESALGWHFSVVSPSSLNEKHEGYTWSPAHPSYDLAFSSAITSMGYTPLPPNFVPPPGSSDDDCSFRRDENWVLDPSLSSEIDRSTLHFGEWKPIENEPPARIVVGMSVLGWHYSVQRGADPASGVVSFEKAVWSKAEPDISVAWVEGEIAVHNIAEDAYYAHLDPPEPPIDCSQDIPGEPGFGLGGECWRNEAGQLHRDPAEGPARILSHTEGMDDYILKDDMSFFVQNGELVGILKEHYVSDDEGFNTSVEYLNAAGQRHREDGPAYRYTSKHNIPEETYLDESYEEFWRDGVKLKTVDHTYEDILQYKSLAERQSIGVDVDGPDDRGELATVFYHCSCGKAHEPDSIDNQPAPDRDDTPASPQRRADLDFGL